MKIFPVVMSGGGGTRLWPISRQSYPKQFLRLNENSSLLQDTLHRLQNIQCEQPIIICNEQHRFILQSQLNEISINATIILEPERKDTAAAIMLAALKARELCPPEKEANIQLLIMSADHFIEDNSVFADLIHSVAQRTHQPLLISLGIKPTSAHTGYGYLQKSDTIEPDLIYRIEKFHEKPDKIKAKEYLDAGNYYWNSGIFLFDTDLFLTEMNQFRPDIYSACCRAMQNQTQENQFICIDKEAFKKSGSDSVDYAVMENTRHAAMAILKTEWSDIGSWDSLSHLYPKDESNNITIGRIHIDDVSNCFIYSTTDRLIAAQGVQDLVIVETPDALLVQHQDTTQSTKKLVNTLLKNKVKEATENSLTHRPWGTYLTLEHGDRFQVKRIVVNPDARLSIQMHHHRSEHWVVVRGVAEIMIGDETRILTENQSTYIPVGVKHCLKNPGKIPLELIEVQSGTYLGEDDIVRFDDWYGR
ncbi:mannose-1-phosphate guanylyltransferase/mannose-6-phosphate isomerase [Stenoxybacter acetivorans]|uniref:mannose-1-phosphate guanylyltransferase/mannose-6-phosphate isomerase n=1 Tax=Stenoxybacter acetivorans TaxID=422441 RepID=UPI0006912DCA|nr:mannose-1-phosphate guanylyltransferase/mannose-6-phosphate isomerase [Stenoxybacter acetivorans]